MLAAYLSTLEKTQSGIAMLNSASLITLQIIVCYRNKITNEKQ